MSIFSRPKQFYQNDMDAFKKPFGFGSLMLFLLVYIILNFIALTIFEFIAKFAPYPTVLVAGPLATYWLCRRFYKQHNRLMSVAEYHSAFRCLSVVLVVFHTITVGLGIFSTVVVYNNCTGANPIPRCNQIQLPGSLDHQVIIYLLTYIMMLVLSIAAVRVTLNVYLNKLRNQHQPEHQEGVS